MYPSLVLDFIKNNQFKKGSIITDAVGIKSYFLQEAMNIIDPDVEFVSGHPMAGREKKVLNMLVRMYLKMRIIY